MPDLPPPGYYPDPEDPSRRRWWDGATWGPLAPPSFVTPNVDVSKDLNNERNLSGVAAAAIAAGIALYLLINLASLFTLDESRAQWNTFRDQLSESLDAAEEGREPRIIEPESSSSVGSSVSAIASLALVGVWGVFVGWSFRAARVARGLGLSKWPPSWSIWGWVIPFVSLVVPYLVLRSAVPVGHPARATINRWWSSWIALQIGGALLAIVPIIVDMQFGLVAAGTLVFAVVVFAAGLACRAVIHEVTEVHTELAGAR